MKKDLIRPCPVCGNRTGDILHHQRFAVPDRFPLAREYDVVVCDRCGFAYADTPSRQMDYDRYYRELSIYEDTFLSTGGASTVWDANRIDHTAEDIGRVIEDRNASIIDVGCANGGLLVALRQRGFERLIGVDPAPACVAHIASQGFRALQGGVFFGEAHNSLPSDETFDCLILCHVLEHICDLRSALHALTRRVNPGGVIYAEVPDASRYSEHFVVPYYYFDCEHINHFDGTSLTDLFTQYGFRCIETGRKSIPVSDTVTYPAVYCAFRKMGQPTEWTLAPASETRRSIDEHLAQSCNDRRFRAIDGLVHTRAKVIAWGAGSYAQRLIENTALGSCNIVAFIDRDIKKQGMRLGEIPVRSPEMLKDFTGKIIICSALHGNEILADIRKQGYINEVIVL